MCKLLHILCKFTQFCRKFAVDFELRLFCVKFLHQKLWSGKGFDKYHVWHWSIIIIIIINIIIIIQSVVTENHLQLYVSASSSPSKLLLVKITCSYLYHHHHHRRPNFC